MRSITWSFQTSERLVSRRHSHVKNRSPLSPVRLPNIGLDGNFFPSGWGGCKAKWKQVGGLQRPLTLLSQRIPRFAHLVLVLVVRIAFVPGGEVVRPEGGIRSAIAEEKKEKGGRTKPGPHGPSEGHWRWPWSRSTSAAAGSGVSIATLLLTKDVGAV